MSQKMSLNVDYTENSFILIDTNKEIIFFKIDLTQDIAMFLPKKPTIGEPIVESISINYKNDFEQILERSMKGDSMSMRVEMTHRLTDQPFIIEITCSPIYVGGQITYFNCTFGTTRVSETKNLRKFDDYSKFASHELRPPITNILSLSNLKNYPKIKNYDAERVSFLLNDIYHQAEKLDNVILVLNGLINDNERVHTKNNQKKHRSPADLINRHIILVDDEPIVNRLHQMLLLKYQKDRTIVDFIDPVLALEYVFKNKPDLIFLDLNMPKINGWEFLKLIEQHDIKVDIIIVSSSIDEHEKIKAKAYPFVKDFLSKPLTSEKINALFSFEKN
jgi:CheY-like chemotaxis protein